MVFDDVMIDVLKNWFVIMMLFVRCGVVCVVMLVLKCVMSVCVIVMWWDVVVGDVDEWV